MSEGLGQPSGLNIFGPTGAFTARPLSELPTLDVVGRFRAGHVLQGKPVSLDHWRITTGDPDVAKFVFEEFGGDEPQEYETKGEDNIEVFSASAEIEIVIQGADAIRQRMIHRGADGKVVIDSDGEFYADGTPDPDAELTFAERKKKGNDNLGPKPQIDVFFRLAENPELGLFQYRSSSWGLAYDLAAGQHADRLATDFDGQPVKATLKLEPVSFVAKTGPRAGKTVSYTKSCLVLGQLA